jgi:hypothetical protein
MSKSNGITPQVTSNPIMLSNEDSLRDQLKQVLAANNTSQSDVARDLRVSKQALSDWLKGKKRRVINGEFEAKLATWLDEHPLVTPTEVKEDEPSYEPKPGDHVDTPTALDVIRGLNHARKHGDFVCIFGPPGVGKTKTLNEYLIEREQGDAWLATMSPSSSGLCQAIEVVAHAVGLKHASGGARRLKLAIEQRIAGRRGILIIDEAQHLSMAAVEELRAIHDTTGVGLALVGNEQSYTRFLGGSHAANYAQINSRIGLKLRLGKPTRQDVAVLAESYGVTGDDCLDVLVQVASRPGALRSVAKMLDLVSKSSVKVDVLSLIAARGMIGAEA